MKKTILFLFTLFFLAEYLSQDYVPLNGIKDNKLHPIVLTNAVVHVNSQNTINNCTVIIESGKIKAVGENLKIPKNAVVHQLN